MITSSQHLHSSKDNQLDPGARHWYAQQCPHGWDPIRLGWDQKRRKAMVHHCTIPISHAYGLDSWTYSAHRIYWSLSWRWIFLRSGLCRRCGTACWDAQGAYPVAGYYARWSQSVRPRNQLVQDKNPNNNWHIWSSTSPSGWQYWKSYWWTSL